MQYYSASINFRQAAPAVVMQGAANMSPPARGAISIGKRVLRRGEELFAEGEDAEYFFKVVSGTIRTYKLLSDGRRQIDAFHLGGDIFGMETGEQHRFSAEAADSATVMTYRRRGFASLAHDDPALGSQIMSCMMHSLERAHDHMLLLGRKTAQEKIATFLLGMAARISTTDRFDLPMQRSDIADHLGLTIETVSRTLTRMVKDGLIKLATAGRSIVLSDMAALRRLNA